MSQGGRGEQQRLRETHSRSDIRGIICAMEYLLRAPSQFDKIKQLDRLCLPPNRRLSSKDRLTIDLSRVNFIKPLGVIGVLLLIESLTKPGTKGGPDISLLPPNNGVVLDYLLKVNFIPALKSLCEWDISDGIRASGRRIKPVIPITRFHNSGEIENIANEMQTTFHENFTGLASLLQPCHVVFSELANNAVEHANSNGGFILAQQYDYEDGSKLEIAVGDCGIGIPGSLKQNARIRGKFGTDQEAIMLVLDGGLSRINDPYRGYGLSHVKEELIYAPDRSLTLRSGTGYAILRAGGRPYSASCDYFPGTLAYSVIPC